MVARALEIFLEPSEVQKVPKIAPKQLFFQKKWQDNFCNYATSDSTECEKATRGYV